MEKIILLTLFSMTMMTGCASLKEKTSVSKLNNDYVVQNVCIEKNPEVKIAEFLPIVEDGFTRHGIIPKVYQGDMPENCIAIAKYTARQVVWLFDGKLYPYQIRIVIFKDNNKVAEITYHNPTDTRRKSMKETIDPLMDEMLKEYPLRK